MRHSHPHSFQSRFAVALVAVGTLAVVPTPAWALGLFSSNLAFQSQDQSMWASGDAFIFDYKDEFLSPAFGTGSIVINPGPIRGGGITVDPRFAFSAVGQMGVAPGFYINSGSVSATIDYGVDIGAASPIVSGTFFKFNGSAALRNSSMLVSKSPTIETYLDGVLKVSVNDFYEAKVSGGTIFNGVRNGTFTSQRDPGHGGPRVDVDARKELFGFNSGGNGRLIWKGADLGGVGDVIKVGNPLAPSAVFTIGDWRIDAAGGVASGAVTAQGQTALLTTAIDVDAALVGPILGPSINTNLGPNVHLSAGYDVVDFDATLTAGYQQQFDLVPSVSVVLNFSDDVLVKDGSGKVSPTRRVAAASIDELPEIALIGKSVDVTPTFSVMADLHNKTDITFALLLQYKAIAGHIELDFSSPFYSDDIYSESFGPLRSWNSDIDPLALSVYDESFALGGFSTIAGQTFTISAVPEPATFMTFGVGLVILLMWVWARDRDHRSAALARVRPTTLTQAL